MERSIEKDAIVLWRSIAQHYGFDSPKRVYAFSLVAYGYARWQDRQLNAAMGDINFDASWKETRKSYCLAVAKHCLGIKDIIVCQRYADLAIDSKCSSTPLEALVEHVPLLCKAFGLESVCEPHYTQFAVERFEALLRKNTTNSEALYGTWREVVAKLKMETKHKDS